MIAYTGRRETCRRYIWRRYRAGAGAGAGTTRGASFARSMDHRSAYERNQRVGASRRAMQQCSTRANARAHDPRTYNNNKDCRTRERWARVRCNKGDNGHYYRRVTSLDTTNRFAGVLLARRRVDAPICTILKVRNLGRCIVILRVSHSNFTWSREPNNFFINILRVYSSLIRKSKSKTNINILLEKNALIKYYYRY